MDTNSSSMFAMLKLRFPHINIDMVNPNYSFSQNLQNIIGQIGMPEQYQSPEEISQMKEAVDKQQLKIQRNLINSENAPNYALSEITNHRKQRAQKSERYLMQPIEEQNSEWNYQEHSEVGGMLGDIGSEIWQFQSDKHRDWFNH